jgi:hypothetical protein
LKVDARGRIGSRYSKVKDLQPMKAAVRKVAETQAEDGSWPIDAANPVGSPATYGATLATYMAWDSLRRVALPETSAARLKAEEKLRAIKPDSVPNAAVLLLFLEKNQEYPSPFLTDTLSPSTLRSAATEDGSDRGRAKSSRFEPLNPTTPLPSLSSPSEGEERVAEGRERSGRAGGFVGVRGQPKRESLVASEIPASGTAALRSSLDLLRRAQTSDGGWGPYADSPPEAFDTALALLALAEFRNEASVPAMVRRSREFLRVTQLPDGSWPATPRPSGGQSYAQQVSTTGWATLALLATR